MLAVVPKVALRRRDHFQGGHSLRRRLSGQAPSDLSNVRLLKTTSVTTTVSVTPGRW
jgi:hypothetical protein